MILILILQCFFLTWTAGEDCNTRCSNVRDRVCGLSTARDGTAVLSVHRNICHLNIVKCNLKDIAHFVCKTITISRTAGPDFVCKTITISRTAGPEVEHVPDTECFKQKRRKSMTKTRRSSDFGIVGAHQVCNHTCPTYCIDTYDPVCAYIKHRDKRKSETRTMVNHCHVDLFSCSVGVNVTITNLASCFKNPLGLMFMSQMAAMKSLGLLDARRSLTDLNMVGLRNRTDDVELDNTKLETEHLLRRLLKGMALKARP